MTNMVYKILLAAVAIASIAQLTVATNYTVGAPSGSWDLQTNLTQWVDSNTFHTGDVLIFTYSASQHDVLEVTKANYDSCTTSSPISIDDSGNTVVPLSTTGTRYFICGIPGHCAGGMKVQIDVSSSSSSSPPSVPSTPESPSPTASSPGNSPPSSAATSVVAGVGLGLSLAAALLVL
ncbi:hypothetical protein LUZ60_002147 [Juncus effusus]|nr:hypothetical protein LUZ60_002147 [Juncus effusus]